MKTISIFTPCYNEEGNVYEMYLAVTKIMKNLPEYDYEYIFIDNCSKDKTPVILRNIAANDSHVKVIYNLRNFGPSRSGFHGFMQTKGDASICLACDFQDPPELIPKFIRMWESGYKVIWGKKIDSDESKLMYVTRTLYYKFIKAFSDVPQYEHTTGFGLYDKEVMDIMQDISDPLPNIRNLIPEFGYDIGIIDYHQPKRHKGKSSYNFFRYFNVALTSMVNTSKIPLRIASFIGFCCSIISFLIGLYYFISKLINWNNFDAGMAPIIIGLFFLGSVQLIFIGILGEYIGEILARVTKRPLVVEKERLNFDNSREKTGESFK